MLLGDLNVEEGPVRVRKPYWSKDSYLVLEFQRGMRTPWAKLHDPCGNKALGQEDPQTILFMDDGLDDWELMY